MFDHSNEHQAWILLVKSALGEGKMLIKMKGLMQKQPFGSFRQRTLKKQVIMNDALFPWI